MNAAVLLFTRYPRPGVVKTRLAASLGDHLATEFYRRCVERVLDEADASALEVRVLLADRLDQAAAAVWLGPDRRLWLQVDGTLTERLTNATERAFAEGFDAVIVAATDTPELSRRHLARAVDGLGSYDAVIGPAVDGGYYLLGLREPVSAVFRGIPWSTDAVAAATLDRLEASGCTYQQLAPLADIDDEADLRAWLTRAPASDPLRRWAVTELSAR